MVVFQTDRPIRREAILHADAYRAAPASRALGHKFSAGRRVEDACTVARDRRTALDVQQDRIPGIADLAREEADPASLGLRRQRGVHQTQARIAQVRPIALSLEA